MSKFQIIVIGIMVAVAAIAMMIFTGVIPGFKKNLGTGTETSVVVWGPFPKTKVISENIKNYFEKKPENYKEELLNAMASGNPPDVFFLTQDMVLGFKDKVEILPFQSFPERNFKDIFADSANIFIDFEKQGIVAFPYIIDPIVLYWNRDLFSSAGLAQIPQFWIDFMSAVPALTKLDETGNVVQSGVAFGEFSNVKNAKEIISMMVLQTNNPLFDSRTMKVVWNEKEKQAESPVESAVRFFNEFSNPKKPIYSWNRSLKNSDDMFSFGSLAMYFGYAGEFENIKKKNPHLNFDVAVVPQIKPLKPTDAGYKATFGKIYALAVPKNSSNKQAAFAFISSLIGKDKNKAIAESLFLVPANRTAMAESSSDPALSVFYKAGIMVKSWLETDPSAVSSIFKNMLESSSSGGKKISEAVSDATRQLEQLLK